MDAESILSSKIILGSLIPVKALTTDDVGHDSKGIVDTRKEGTTKSLSPSALIMESKEQEVISSRSPWTTMLLGKKKDSGRNDGGASVSVSTNITNETGDVLEKHPEHSVSPIVKNGLLKFTLWR